MSLDDLLKQDNEARQKQKQANEEHKTAQQKKEQEFTDSLIPCFDEVISPTIKENIEVFKANGHTAVFGQNVERVTHLSSLKTLSFSVIYHKCTMQLDVTASKMIQRIELKFRFISKHKLDNSVSLTISEVTKEKINSLIELNVKAMQQHCG